MSELAKIAGGERALVEECGDLLSKTYASQVCNYDMKCFFVALAYLGSFFFYH